MRMKGGPGAPELVGLPMRESADPGADVGALIDALVLNWAIELVGAIPNAANAVAARLKDESLAEDTVDLLELKTVEHSRRCLELLQAG